MMQSLQRRLLPCLLVCAGLLLPAVSADVQKGQQAQLLLEQATKKELIDGDLKGAIEAYQKILTLEGVPRAVVATALLQLGQCHERLGDAEARKAYERLVREFADQADLAAQARARLASLGGRDEAMRIRQVWAGSSGTPWAPTRDGRYVLFQDSSENLAVRELATGQTRRLTSIPVGTLEFFSAFAEPSPDGKQVAYAWYDSDGLVDVRVVGFDGSNPRVLYADRDLKGEAYPEDWSPDGNSILATHSLAGGSTRILVVPASGGGARVLKVNENKPSRPRFSPDGRYIAYMFEAGSNNRDIAILKADGTSDTRAVEHPANDVFFDWTPDGKHLLFASDRSGTVGAWSVPIAEGRPAGAPVLVKPDLGDVRPMGFIRDGSFYYGVSRTLSDVYIAEVDFASGRLVADPILATERLVGSNSRPTWSADGRQLAYLSQRRPGAWGARAICVKDTETGRVREITSKFEIVIGIHWSPDGRFLWAFGQSPAGDRGPFQINVQTGEFEPVSLSRPAPIGQSGVAWSPDGKTFFYPRWGPADGTSSIVARDLASGEEKILSSVADPAVYQTGVSISRNGQWLATVARDKGEEGGGFRGLRHVLVVSTAGGVTRDVLTSRELAWPISIAWAPDGQGVLFVKQPDARDPMTELWLVPVQGGEPRKLDLKAEGIRDLRVHPDGRHIAYTSGRDRSEVWAMENFLPAVK